MDIVQNQTAPQAETPEPEIDYKLELERYKEEAENKYNALRNSLNANNRVQAKQQQQSAPPTTDAIKAVQDLELKLAQTQITRTLNSSLDGIGVQDPVKVANFFRANYGDRISVNDDGETIFTEANGNTLLLGEYLQSWAKSEGAMFIPASRMPTGIQSSGRAVPTASSSAYRSMNFEQIMAKRKIDPSGFKNYLDQYPQEYAKKKGEAERGY